MFKKIYMVLGTGVVLLYVTASWMGWEMANSSSRPGRFGTPFFYTGFRGGK
jgi:hypothetical protein